MTSKKNFQMQLLHKKIELSRCADDKDGNICIWISITYVPGKKKIYKVLVAPFEKYGCFSLSFLTLNIGRPKEFHMPFYLISSFQNRVKYYNMRFKFQRYIDYSNIVLNWRVKIYWTGRRNVALHVIKEKTSFYNQILIILWCLKFGYCTGKRTEQTVVSEEEIKLFGNLKSIKIGQCWGQWMDFDW